METWKRFRERKVNSVENVHNHLLSAEHRTRCSRCGCQADRHGSNNSGKSSILESLRARAGYQPVSFTSGTRNTSVDEVIISYIVNGNTEKLRSIRKGSSETQRDNPDGSFEIFVLPSRRAFEPYFGKHTRQRSEYVQVAALPPQRSSVLNEFSARLFNIIRDPEAFNKILTRALGFEAEWSIDLSDQGQYFLKFFRGKHAHSSDGMGEGIVSLFAIVDALHDSSLGSMIVIDEPELSLHPSLQRRVASLLAEYAKDRQIVVSTHSPY
ncbi:MAG: ATP-binding protein, partial [Pyrinomonadaceae bacterium]|nr:ATP-binding protein [Pyrinomonadaceae bacterium]